MWDFVGLIPENFKVLPVSPGDLGPEGLMSMVHILAAHDRALAPVCVTRRSDHVFPLARSTLRGL